MNWPFYLSAIFLSFALDPAEARQCLSIRARIKLNRWVEIRDQPPVKTVARPRDEETVTALPCGRILESDSPNEFVKKMMQKRAEKDLLNFRQILRSKPMLSQQEAFYLYKDALIANSAYFKTEILTVCQPIILPQKLVKFVMLHLHFLEDILNDFPEKRSDLEVMLLEEALASVIDEAGYQELIRVCNLNAPLSNGYPLIYHVIFNSHLPNYFFDRIFHHTQLDLNFKGCLGNLPAEWSDWPLLMHAWIYNERAFAKLVERIPINEILPSITQTFQWFI